MNDRRCAAMARTEPTGQAQLPAQPAELEESEQSQRTDEPGKTGQAARAEQGAPGAASVRPTERRPLDPAVIEELRAVFGGERALTAEWDLLSYSYDASFASVLQPGV